MVGSTVGFVFASAVAGVFAAIAMAYPMWKQSDGFAPAYVAAGLLTRRNPVDVPMRDALVVHHAAGPCGGILYAALAIILWSGLPGMATIAGVPLVPHVLATILVVTIVYFLFANVALPRAGAGQYEETHTAVRGQWLRSALVFGAALVVFVPVFSSAFV